MIQVQKLIADLDQIILSLRMYVRPHKAWQRQLLELVDKADREMQILRMTTVMKKSEQEIAESALQLGRTCKQINQAIRGTRADALVQSCAATSLKIAEAIAMLVRQDGKSSETGA